MSYFCSFALSSFQRSFGYHPLENKLETLRTDTHLIISGVFVQCGFQVFIQEGWQPAMPTRPRWRDEPGPKDVFCLSVAPIWFQITSLSLKEGKGILKTKRGPLLLFFNLCGKVEGFARAVF